jgi:hypothetical protein
MFLNVPIPAGALLTLTGLLDTRTSSGRLDIIGGPTGALAYGNFSQSTGTLIIPILLGIPALTRLSFQFIVINPVSANFPSKEDQVKVRLDRVCNLQPDYVLAQPSGGVIRVKQATFSVKKIGQKTSWPGAANVITITLNADVALYGEAVRCDTNITISGFDGACIRSESVVGNSTLMKLLLIGPNASIFRNVTWNPETKAISMRLGAALGVTPQGPAIFSFAFVNPVASQPSPRIEIGTQGIPISLSEMDDKDGSILPDSRYDHNKDGVWNDSIAEFVGSPNGPVFNSTLRAAEPLRVYSPAFVVKTIGQSSPYPGHNNTLTLTIQPNIDISVGAVIVISSLVAVDGTTRAESGETCKMHMDAEQQINKFRKSIFENIKG